VPLYRAEVKPRRLFGKPRLHDPSQVLYLPFDKDDGAKVRDRSGYNNHGTIYGATRVSGKIGDALSFDGVDDYAEVPDSPYLDLTDGFTVSLWIYPKTPYPTTYPIPIIKGLGSTCNYMFQFSEEAAQMIDFYYYNAGWRSSGGASIVNNEWNFVSGTWDGTFLKIYVDGVLRNKSNDLSETPPIPNTFPLRIGREPTWEFFGLIDELRIFNRALSAAEIQRLMKMRVI